MFFVELIFFFEVTDSSNTSRLILRAGPLDHNRVNIKYLKHTKTTQNIYIQKQSLTIRVCWCVKRINAKKKKCSTSNGNGSGVKSLRRVQTDERTLWKQVEAKRTTDTHGHWQTVTINEIPINQRTTRFGRFTVPVFV